MVRVGQGCKGLVHYVREALARRAGNGRNVCSLSSYFCILVWAKVVTVCSLHIHSKIRNSLEPATTEKLVYVYSNSKMVSANGDANKLKMLAWAVHLMN